MRSNAVGNYSRYHLVLIILGLMARTQLCISMRRRQVNFYHSGSLLLPFWTVYGSFGSHLGSKPGGVSRNAGGFCLTLYQPLRTERLRVLEQHAAAEKGQGRGPNANNPDFIFCQKHSSLLIFFIFALLSVPLFWR